MYRRPKFLQSLLDIRCAMALEADYDVVLFVERVREIDKSTETISSSAHLGDGTDEPIIVPDKKVCTSSPKLK